MRDEEKRSLSMVVMDGAKNNPAHFYRGVCGGERERKLYLFLKGVPFCSPFHIVRTRKKLVPFI